MTSGFSSTMARSAWLPSATARVGTSACVSSRTAASRVLGSSSISSTLFRLEARIGARDGASLSSAPNGSSEVPPDAPGSPGSPP